MTQGMVEYEEEEGIKEEHAKEAPTKPQPKKRKASTNPPIKSKKSTKKSPRKCTTRALHKGYHLKGQKIGQREEEGI